MPDWNAKSALTAFLDAKEFDTFDFDQDRFFQAEMFPPPGYDPGPADV